MTMMQTPICVDTVSGGATGVRRRRPVMMRGPINGIDQLRDALRVAIDCQPVLRVVRRPLPISLEAERVVDHLSDLRRGAVWLKEKLAWMEEQGLYADELHMSAGAVSDAVEDLLSDIKGIIRARTDADELEAAVARHEAVWTGARL